MTKSIGVVNCGIGNLQSLSNALTHISDAKLVISADLDQLDECDNLIMPGVGSFATASQKLDLPELKRLLLNFSSAGKPVLGICLGMQLLYNSSNEGGYNHGLSLIEGEIKHFSDHENYRDNNSLLIPHVGFNSLKFDPDSKLFANVDPGALFYFTHSYYASPLAAFMLSTTSYGKCEFASSINVGSIYAVQFHPELSGEPGLQLLKNFLDF